MAQFVERQHFQMPVLQDSMQPKKVFLPPPGLDAAPYLADPPGFGPPGVTVGSWQVPPGFDTLSAVDLEYQSSMYWLEHQQIEWMHSWTLADQDSWDRLYETCTTAALGRVTAPLQGQVAPLCCAKTRSPGSDADASEETDSTADTTLGGDQEAIVHDDGIDALSQALLAGGDEQQQALDSVTDQLQAMCQTQRGSRLVQSAVAVAAGNALDALLVKLLTFLPEASRSPHGSHVVLACINVLGRERAHVIAAALSSKAVQLARDRFGCRTAQLLVEVCSEESAAPLIDELMQDAARLCRHPFGNYVMQSVVKFGTAARRAQLADVFVGDAYGLSRHRFAKHAFQLAVVHGDPSDRARLVAASKRPMEYFMN